jgi:DNA cross-link repair 1C protein
MEDVRYKLLAVLRSTKMTISLDDLGLLGLDRDQNEMSITHFAELVSRSAVKKRNTTLTEGRENKAKGLPKVITFPYSRHSSFPELCALVSAFKPKDVYPCTVDEGEWHEGI